MADYDAGQPRAELPDDINRLLALASAKLTEIKLFSEQRLREPSLDRQIATRLEEVNRLMVAMVNVAGSYIGSCSVNNCGGRLRYHADNHGLRIVCSIDPKAHNWPIHP